MVQGNGSEEAWHDGRVPAQEERLMEATKERRKQSDNLPREMRLLLDIRRCRRQRLPNKRRQIQFPSRRR